MSDAIDDERERIREQKLADLKAQLEGGSRPPASDTSNEESPSNPIEIDGPDHLQSVVSEHPVVLVDCYADWCGPCQMLEPTIDAIASETNATVAKVDIDANQRLAQQLGVRGVPTLVLYANGGPKERLSGVQDRATLETLIERYS
ncbi:thioredoxin family protein [Halovivax gelatinilyticus]|uniref:thioredoxin family protein n=1 Tax=Halovivax gelatinilyticus TaxID=2961597 RepID=UPI0020CA80CC|nr:thioredoxin family protein [Halovivax gelatinilyticus]